MSVATQLPSSDGSSLSSAGSWPPPLKPKATFCVNDVLKWAKNAAKHRALVKAHRRRSPKHGRKPVTYIFPQLKGRTLRRFRPGIPEGVTTESISA